MAGRGGRGFRLGQEVKAVADVNRQSGKGGPRGFHPYPDYRDSGVEWLGEIPAHWTAKALKRPFGVVNGSTPKSAEPEYWNGDIPWVTPDDLGRMTDRVLKAPARYITGKGYEACGTRMVPCGSLILSTRAPIGHLAIAGMPLCTNQGCRSLVFRNPDSEAFFYFQLCAARPVLEATGRGSTFKELAKEDLEAITLCVPPPTEQRAIAAFLDRETAKIDALVAKKERLIELLQEKRTALITRAVTRGLDPNVPMKNPGVGWLCEIPAHWKIIPARRLVLGIEQGWSPVAEDRPAASDEWGVIKLSAVSAGSFREWEHKTLPSVVSPDARYEIRENDFLLTRSNTPDLVGDVCVVGVVRSQLLLCDLVYRLNLIDDRVDRSFLAYWFLSRAGRHQIKVEARGSSRSMVKVSQGIIRAWTVAAPSLAEQAEIAMFLDHELTKIDALIAKVQKAIDHLTEYRTALISAAVTGKIDIRKEAA